MKPIISLAIPGVLLFLVVMTELAKAESLTNPQLPPPEVRKSMVRELAKQVGRIDGEGLLPRANRPESWEKTVAKLSDEASTAKSLYDLGRVFRRFDATYPNLHANVFLIAEMDEEKNVGSLKFPFSFLPVSADREHKSSNFRLVINKEAKTDLKTGDELVAINSRPLQEWTDENFIFCKFPLREQC